MTLERNDDVRLAEEDAEQADLRTEATNADDMDSDEVEVAEIRTEIEETRVEMGGTLNELGERLEPAHLMDEAKENVREATVGRVEETAKGMSEMVMETIKHNPIPAAMAGAGLALLWKNRSSGNGNGSGQGPRPLGDRYSPYYGTTADRGQRAGGWSEGGDDDLRSRAGQAASSMGDKASGAVGSVGDKASGAVGEAGERAQEVGGEIVDRGQQAAQEVGWRLERFMQASPLAVGAIAIGAGALIGALIPETEQEREMLGDASRQVGEMARDTVEQAGQQAEQTLDETERSMS